MKKRKLTEEEKKARTDFLIDLFIGGAVFGVVGCIIGSLVKSNKELINENKELERKNANLKGRNRSLKDENKRLVRENYEACYHLGKKSVSHPRRVIKIKK